MVEKKIMQWLHNIRNDVHANVLISTVLCFRTGVEKLLFRTSVEKWESNLFVWEGKFFRACK